LQVFQHSLFYSLHKRYFPRIWWAIWLSAGENTTFFCTVFTAYVNNYIFTHSVRPVNSGILFHENNRG
jgi:hypothetical protein